MRRIKKNTPASFILLSIGSIFLPLMLFTGNLFFGIGLVVCVVLGIVSRKPESWDAYRNRYEQQYGMDESETEEDG